jgi:hypothetical protein
MMTPVFLPTTAILSRRRLASVSPYSKTPLLQTSADPGNNVHNGELTVAFSYHVCGEGICYILDDREKNGGSPSQAAQLESLATKEPQVDTADSVTATSTTN